MLSNRITANNLEEKPASHAKSNTVNTIKLFQPDGFETEFFSSFLSPIFHREIQMDTSFIFTSANDILCRQCIKHVIQIEMSVITSTFIACSCRNTERKFNFH